MDERFCEHCGSEILPQAVMCVKCGRQIKDLEVKKDINPGYNQGGPFNKECDKTTAILLCFFLGWIGAHKFYEGKTGLGVLYLFTAGLCGFGVLIDFITILGKPDKYYV